VLGTAVVRGVHYVAVMADGQAPAGRSVKFFDDVADEYDRWRPTYPDELVIKACELAGIGSGDRVLEVGCGSGQLTHSLLARGLQVVAVEPGGRLLSLAEGNLQGCEDVDFVHVPFEDTQLPRGHFRAVFSASAFHWINPEVSWQKAADVLVPGGTLALIQYFGLSDKHSRADHELLLAAMGRIAPEVASEWPSYRDLATTVAGVERRSENISEAWGWLGGYDLTQARAGKLFTNVQMAAVPVLLEYTADELNALARTMSFYARLTPAQRQALEGETAELCERLGRPMRSSTVAVVVTARRNGFGQGRLRENGLRHVAAEGGYRPAADSRPR
jgi:SAM-dependent methyltransferase